tara:strand:- start:1972 stop:4011 length:2040 start_codon:yes stop_codon:yes gene_type:complete
MTSKIQFSETLYKRLIYAVFGVVFVLLMVSIYLTNISFEKSLSSKYFSPLSRIDRISILGENYLMNSSTVKKAEGNNDSEEGFKKFSIALDFFGCSIRQKALIFSMMHHDFSFSTMEGKLKFIGDISTKFRMMQIPSCSQILSDLKVVKKLQISNDKFNRNIKYIVGNFLKEQVRWDWKTPCIFHSSRKFEKLYLAGPIEDCFFKQKANRFLEGEESHYFRRLAKLIQKRVAVGKNKNVVNYAPPNLFLTLIPEVQNVLNSYKLCFQKLEQCEHFSWSHSENIEGFSIVILDAESSAILGSICVGEKCTENGRASETAPFLVESPPASISKLFFGLAIGSREEVEQKMLRLQIKTSGQLDRKMGTRNEWWERQSVCDYNLERPCKTIYSASEYASIMGFATSCSSFNAFLTQSPYKNVRPRNCGIFSLIKTNTSLYLSENFLRGFAGYIPINERLILSEAGFADFMRWKKYEELRRADSLVKKEGDKFFNTSVVIQSVIGGGDSRITSLGLASIPSNLHQMSVGKRVELPFLVTDDPERSYKRKFIPAFASSDKRAAKLVLNGMQKVLAPAEGKWMGNGTASKDFKFIFGKWCSPSCPIYGKTGTVSARDPANAGTTVFSGVTKRLRLSKFLKVKTNNYGIDTYAIGVMVFADKESSNYNLASRLHMSVLKDILFYKDH